MQKNIFRVVITGPVGAGKTTFVQTISEIEVVDTEQVATDEIAELKATTTVAMDFGRLSLGEQMWLHLYGTPGQDRFSFMWDILIRKAHGYVLLIPAHLPNLFREARAIKNFMEQRVNIPMVIGVTHTDHPDAWDPDDIKWSLTRHNQVPHPCLAIDARNPSSVAEALLIMAEQLTEKTMPTV